MEFINQYVEEEHSTPNAIYEDQVCIDDSNEDYENFIDDSAETKNEQQALDYFALRNITRSFSYAEEGAFSQSDVEDFLGSKMKLIIISLTITDLKILILIKKLIILTALKKESKI